MYNYTHHDTGRIMNSRTLIGILEEDGWQRIRTESSHVTFKHPLKKQYILTVPHPKKDLPIGTVSQILRKAGLK